MLGLKIVKHLYIGHFAVKLLGLCKNHKIITATKQFIPMLGTLYSHVGNIFVKPHTEYEFSSLAEYVFLFPAEIAEITERAAPAMRYDYQ